MKTQIMLAHFGSFPHAGGIWGFIALVLVILVVTLWVGGGSKDKNE